MQRGWFNFKDNGASKERNQPQFDKLQHPNSTCLGWDLCCKQQWPVPAMHKEQERSEAKQNNTDHQNTNAN